MRRLVRATLAVLLLLALAAGGVAWWGWATFHAPGPSVAPHTVVVARGTRASALADQLEAAGVVGSARLFLAAITIDGSYKRLKAGEYLFPAGISPAAVRDKLLRGDTVVHQLTLPEGITVAEALKRIGEAEALAGVAPGQISEGSLLPETYNYSLGDQRGELVARMRQAMAERLARAWAGRAPGLPLARPEDLLTLASIVEKETAIPAERAKVAAVFVNRLRRGMRLQSDPTVVYAVTGGAEKLDRPLTRDDLAVDSPYNTYRYEGLPPGPIALPGAASLDAAAHPADSDALYFVADGSGGHVFARTIEEHNRNVANWRRLERDRAPP